MIGNNSLDHTKQKPDIISYFHCRKCFGDRPPDITPAKWAMLSAGWTEIGLQIWCERCEMNVMNLDFKGQKVGFA